MFVLRTFLTVGVSIVLVRSFNIAPWPISVCKANSTGDCDNNSYTNMTAFETCNTIDDCKLKIGVIIPSDTSYIVNQQGVSTTFNEFKNNLNSTIEFTLEFYDDQCMQEHATVNLIPAVNNHAHVIFGPICDYCLASVSRVAKYIGYHGMPVVTPGGFTYAFTKQKVTCSDEYYMTINTGPTDFRSFGEFFYLLMAKYGWTKIALMYEKNRQSELAGGNTCKFVLESIIEEVKVIGKLDYQDGDIELLNKNFTDYLKELVGVNYGIIVTCTSHERLREFAIKAYDLNMMESGEYNVFAFETFNDNANNISRPWYSPNDTDENNEKAKKAFKSVYTFTSEGVLESAKSGKDKNSIYLDGLYDGMLLYSHAIEQVLNETYDQTPKGYDVIRKMMGTNFPGKNGDVIMNCNGQRVANYVMLQMGSHDEYRVAAIYSNQYKNITAWNVNWPFGEPKDTPVCGYDQSLCPPIDTVKILMISLILVLCLGVLIVGIILYRHFKLKKAIYSMAWKVNYDDIVLLPDKPRSSFQSMNSLRRGSQHTIENLDGLSVAGDRQHFTEVGFYKAIRVAMKSLQDVKLELNREQLLELKVMKDLSHDNLVKFYGACVDIPNIILSEYCPKGSLYDILENDNVKLDTTFKMSLLMDIVRGMHYLHSSVIKSHGALKSPNCLVDSRFVLKIGDFGLHFLRKHSKDSGLDDKDHKFWERQLWTAPELLRMENPPRQGTQKGDVYSFGIIMHEIVMRQGLFYLDEDRDIDSELN